MPLLSTKSNVFITALCLLSALFAGAQTHQMAGGMKMEMPKPKSPAKTARATTTPLPVTAQSASVVAVPPLIKETSAFMVLKNTSAQPLKLTVVSAAVASHAMLMHTIKTANMTGMIPADSLTVPANGTLTLKNDGDHVMLSGLKRVLKVGETLPLTLTDALGRSMTLKAVVKKP